MPASSVYQDLTAEELNAMIEKSLHTTITGSRHLTGGLFNTTYAVETADCGSVVLRVGPVNRHLLMHFEHDLMESEEAVYAMCHARGIPVSEVLACDTTKSILDRDFMIVRNIPSSPMSECEADLSPDDRARICREIGEATKNFHAIEGEKFGRIAEVKHGGGFDQWSECMMTEFERWENIAAPTGLFSPDEHKAARTVLTETASILDEIKTPHLVHADLWFGNILVTKDEHPRFAAIIDADRAMWGDTEIDFSSIPWTQESPTFWEGYGKPLPMDDHNRIRRMIYTMMWSLFDTYVWLHQYNNPDNAAYTKNKTLDQIRMLKDEFGIGTGI